MSRRVGIVYRVAGGIEIQVLGQRLVQAAAHGIQRGKGREFRGIVPRAQILQAGLGIGFLPVVAEEGLFGIKFFYSISDCVQRYYRLFVCTFVDIVTHLLFV